MTKNHPITPPPELVQDWWDATQKEKPERWVNHVATQAARWGADQELDACCELLTNEWGNGHGDRLHRLRRPKPPSLKEQALEVLERSCFVNQEDETTIRRALEQLPE